MKRLLLTRNQVITLALALATGCLLFWIGAPLPFLFGSLSACLIAATLGVPLEGTPLLSIVSRTTLGVAIGASITWSLLSQFASIAPTLLLVPVYIVVIAFVGVYYFQHILGYDKTTAYYAAMPGALQDMVAFGEEAGGNARSLSLIHATRLLLMVTIAPLILIWFYGANLNHPLGPPASELPFYHVLIILGIGITGWKLASWAGLFGASVLGPILLSIPLSLAGILTERPSQEMIMVSQFFIGLGVGINYRGITPIEIRRDILAASGFVIILLGIAALFTFTATLLSDLDSTEIYLAFWPAGQAEIAVLSLAAGINVGIVVAHHLVRLIIIILGAPTLAHYFTRSATDHTKRNSKNNQSK